ncbi:MAG: hypothetical protein ACLTZT_03090 [Butyricimonas faecalis]
MKKMYGDNSRPGIAHLLKVMENQTDLTENEYEEISNTYRFDLKNKAKADSVDQVILKLFPHGGVARFNRSFELIAYLGRNTLRLPTGLERFPDRGMEKESESPGSRV